LRTQKLPHSELEVSCVGFGLSGQPSWTPGPITNDDIDRVSRLMQCALEAGVTLFDTASPYGLGRSETVMGQVFERAPSLRERAIVQTKCGQIMTDDDGNLVTPRIDLSKREIISSAERSLRRLKRDRIDILLLHQPTPLMRPEEIVAAFTALHESGKVRYFGVSSFSPEQITLIQRLFARRLVVNQVQVSLYHPRRIIDGMGGTLCVLEHLDLVHQRLSGVATPAVKARHWVPAGDSIIDYCRIEGVQVQAWSPLRHRLPGAYQPQTDFTTLDARLAKLARELDVSAHAIALAWLLKHPAAIVPIMSTSNPEHIFQNAKAAEIQLSESDWYALLRDAIEAVEAPSGC